MSLIESTPFAGSVPANIANSPWTDERIEDLKRLWLAENLTAYQIACAIGGLEYCSDGGKNAVIGKARRLGLKAHRKSPGKTPWIRPKKAKTRHVATHLYKRRAEAAQVPVAEPVPEPEFSIPRRQRRTLLQLEPYDCKCRYPIGDPNSPDFFFCGGKAPHGPYCAYHGRIAYQSPASRRDRRPVPA